MATHREQVCAGDDRLEAGENPAKNPVKNPVKNPGGNLHLRSWKRTWAVVVVVNLEVREREQHVCELRKSISTWPGSFQMLFSPPCLPFWSFPAPDKSLFFFWRNRLSSSRKFRLD